VGLRPVELWTPGGAQTPLDPESRRVGAWGAGSRLVLRTILDQLKPLFVATEVEPGITASGGGAARQPV
jgi:hypothetical protein